MINSLAVFLVLSSLSAASFWSPSPGKYLKEGEDFLAGNAHGVAVVDDGEQPQQNTRVPTSDPHGSISVSSEEQRFDQPQQNTRVSTSDRHEQRLSSSNHLQTKENGGESDIFGPKELISDALGKYGHKISTAFGKAKEAGFVKAEDVEEKAKETIRKVKDKVSEITEDFKERVKETVKKGGERLKEAKEMGKTIRHDMATNVSETVETTEEEANARGKETTKTLNQVVKWVKDSSQKAANDLIQGGRKLVILTAAFMAAPALAGAVNVFGVAIAFGMGVWVTFLSSYVLARAIPRHQVAMAHSKIYPTYFRAMAVSIVVTFLGHLLRRKIWSSPDMAPVLQGYNLLGALLLVFANLFVEPRARKVMCEKEKAEKDGGRCGRGEVEMVDSVLTDKAGRESHDHPYETEDADNTLAVMRRGPPPPPPPSAEGKPTLDELTRRLKKLNFYASFLNSLTLMALAWHLVFINQRLSFNF